LPFGQAYGGPLFLTNIHFWVLIRDTLKINTLIMEQNVISPDKLVLCQQIPKIPLVCTGIWGLTASDNPTGYNAQSPTMTLE